MRSVALWVKFFYAVTGSGILSKMVDIDQLTNEEIRDQLMIRGCDPGPVIGTTRNVYANKLRRLLEEGSESNVIVPSESSPKHKDTTTQSRQKSSSPRRVTRSSAQETNDLQNTPIISKTSRMSPKASDVSPSLSRIISDPKQPSSKTHVVQPSFLLLLNHVTSITSDPSPLNIISDSVEVPKSHPRGTVTEISHATPTTRFTSLRIIYRISGKSKVSDGSDDDLRGEESSRILSPSWNEDHIYSTLYNSEQRSTAHRLGENSANYYNPASRYSSGVAFENSYSGYGNRHNDLKAKEKNYAELERGEGNKEEF
ncbi:hypothetical protein DINM_003217 [Dirofilaria immitis]|nr:hypothetical protein [Dirofilaria immitis]